MDKIIYHKNKLTVGLKDKTGLYWNEILESLTRTYSHAIMQLHRLRNWQWTINKNINCKCLRPSCTLTWKLKPFYRNNKLLGGLYVQYTYTSDFRGNSTLVNHTKNHNFLWIFLNFEILSIQYSMQMITKVVFF